VHGVNWRYQRHQDSDPEGETLPADETEHNRICKRHRREGRRIGFGVGPTRRLVSFTE
jgi:hypothetical protein